MQHKNILHNGCNIFYRISGEGKAVMLLHGFGEDGNIWNNILPELKDHKVIIPDIPGSGLSDFSENYISVEDHAEIISVIINNEGITNFTLIGHSLGGYITLAFAEKYFGLLNGWGLFHSSAFADNEEKKAVRKKAIEFIKTKGAEAFLKTTIPALFGEAYKKSHETVIEDLIKNAGRFCNEALIQYYEAMIIRPDRTNILKLFNKPVLFIIGEKDNAVPLQSSLQQCYLPAVSHVNILPEVAHMGMLEDTKECSQYLNTFLESLTV